MSKQNSKDATPKPNRKKRKKIGKLTIRTLPKSADILDQHYPPLPIGALMGNVPPHRQRRLRPYQEKILQWALTKKNIGLFLEMRLGKSILALRWALEKAQAASRAIRSNTPEKGISKNFRGTSEVILEITLGSHSSSTVSRFIIDIVAPKTTLISWIKEIDQDTQVAISTNVGESQVRYIVGIDDIGLGIINLTSYESFTQKQYSAPTHLGLSSPTILIVDESSYIKNPTSQRTRFMLDSITAYDHIAILSGLPIPKDVTDLIPQLAMINHGDIGGYKGPDLRPIWYNSKMIKRDSKGWNYEITPYGLSQIKKIASDRTLSLTRKDLGMGIEKIYIEIPIDLSTHMRAKYDAAETNWIDEDGNLLKWRMTRDHFLSQLAISSKIEKVVDLIKSGIYGKVVLWVRYSKTMIDVCTELQTLGYSVYTISGKDSLRTRQSRLNAFKSHRTRRLGYENELLENVLIIQTKCGKFGLDLSYADTAIYLSPGYDLEDRYQSEDRLVSVNRETSPVIIDLVCQDTIEQDMYQILSAKKKTAEEFLGSLNSELSARRLAKWANKHRNQTMP